MKKQLSLVAIFVFIALMMFTAIARQKENKGSGKDKAKQEKQDKDNRKREGKDKNKDTDNSNQDRMNDDDNGKGKGKEKDRDIDEMDDDKGRARGNEDRMKDGYKWDSETFRDRNKYKKQDKVTICHKINRNDEPPVTLRVSSNALKAHLNHGDLEGECTAVTNSKYSNDFLQRRTDYYATLQDGQEQVVYSRSILDYALERLTNARSQMVVLQRNNAPQADIERKQTVIADLEQNVSLLERLLGITANLVVNKLSN